MSDEMLWYVISEDNAHIYGPYAARTPLYSQRSAEDSLRALEKRHPASRNYRAQAMTLSQAQELKSNRRAYA